MTGYSEGSMESNRVVKIASGILLAKRLGSPSNPEGDPNRKRVVNRRLRRVARWMKQS